MSEPSRRTNIKPDPVSSLSSTTISSSNCILPTPDNIISSTAPIPSTSDDSDSYIEPAWCWEADTIRETIYDSEQEAETAVLNLVQLFLDDDISDTNIFYLRGRIVIYWAFEALPLDYRGSVAVRY